MTSIDSKTLIRNLKKLCPGTKNYKIYGYKNVSQLYTSGAIEIYNDLEKKRKKVGIEKCYRIHRKIKIINLLKNIYNNSHIISKNI